MGNISQIPSNGYNTNVYTGITDADGDNNLYKEKLVFRPSELGLKDKRPPTIELTEKQVETKIFEKYKFDVNDRV